MTNPPPTYFPFQKRREEKEEIDYSDYSKAEMLHVHQQNSNQNDRTDENVINVRVQNLRKRGYPSLRAWLDASDSHVYIGRRMQYINGANQSVWHNPYRVKAYGLQRSLELYEKRIRETPALWHELENLQGKCLGCWCVPDAACHGQVLSRLIQEKENEKENKKENENVYGAKPR